MSITGLNHLTLAVSDLDRAVVFYRDLLGCELRAVWAQGAYLEAGSLWLCLSLDVGGKLSTRTDYTHVAFSVREQDFGALRQKVIAGCELWQEDKSEGNSVYFLDPDGHKLEIHVGSLETRLGHYRENPSKGVTVLVQNERVTPL